MYLRRCLAFLEARWQCQVVGGDVSGMNNRVADALSRNQMALFRSLRLQDRRDPVGIPVEVLDVLVVSKPD